MKYSFIILLFLLAGCKGQEWAAKSIATIHYKHPEMEAENCTFRFPVISDTTIRHTTSIDTVFTARETVFVDCNAANRLVDSLLKLGITPPDLGKVPVDCPPNKIIHQVDTFLKIVREESSANLKIEQLARAKDIKRADNNRTWAIVGFSLAGILGIALFISIKTKPATG
jgi:hypothetical protein